MPLDAMFLSRLVEEHRGIVGMHIDKIQQPVKHELLLSLRGNGTSGKLLLSARAGAARLHWTQTKRENPAEPPMFCMLLRKHLAGGRIAEIAQIPGERIVRMEVESFGDLGEQRRRSLVLEAMGQQANLILLDEDGRILDALRRVEGDLVTGKRQVLPGLFYTLPQPMTKPFVAALTAQQAYELVQQTPAPTLADAMVRALGGLSPLLCREFAFRCGGVELASVSEERFVQTFQTFVTDAMKPSLLYLNGEAKDFSFLEIQQYETLGRSEAYSTLAQLLDAFYGAREQTEQMRARGETLRRFAERAQARLLRKIAAQKRELEQAGAREQLRIYGDLITSNLHRMQKGAQELLCENYYDADCAQIAIRLDPLKTPQQNAAKYYKDYARMKTAEEKLYQQIAQAEAELEYMSTVLDSVCRAQNEADLQSIREELTQNGYLKAQSGKKRMKPQAQKPMEYQTQAGRRVLVGRNNLQNEQLSFRIARHTDVWLHVQKAPGSHVILESDDGTVDEASLLEAAKLAVQHSSQAGGSKIAVDYTPVRYLKKVPGGKTGMVIYHKYQTLLV